MNIEELREYCLKKTDVEESFPFDETVLVFKVSGKFLHLQVQKESSLSTSNASPKKQLNCAKSIQE